MDPRFFKSAIESILFISDKPVTVSHLLSIFEDYTEEKVKSLIADLQEEYESSSRGMRIQNVGGGFRMTTDPANFKYVKKFFKEKKVISFSLASLECLALIAYKQPITVPEINRIRNIDSSAVVKNLLSKGMIKILGKKDAPGRPYIYGTTKEFLVHFGIQDLESLPTFEEIKQILE
ncbi:SMC-Scp complex subunit ScpB [bacterium]|nr:SMC-Scp complex subunit ScpB [bacterium]